MAEQHKKTPYEDQELYNLILSRFKRSKSYRDKRKLDQDWEYYEKLYENRYWEGSGRPAGLTRATSNNFFEGIEVTLPVVTARPPRPEITPDPQSIDDVQNEEKMEAINKYAEQIQRELINIWRDTKMDIKIQEAYREHGVKGKHLTKSIYDPDEGEFDNEIKDIFTIFPDPFKDSVEEASKSWFIDASIVSVRDFKKEYGIDVEPEGDLNEYTRSYTYRKQTGESEVVTEEGDKREGHVLVIEHYSPDVTEEEYEDYEYDDDGLKKKDKNDEYLKQIKTRLKYPYGRVVTIVRNLDARIIRDSANPYSLLPYFETTNYKRAGDFWGMSEGKQVEAHIRMKNQILSNINDNIRLTGNPVEEVVEGSGIKSKTNKPGSRVKSNIPGGFRFVEPPRMPAYIQAFIDYLDRDTDRKMGVTDAFRGMSTFAGESGVKTQALIAQSTGRLQPKVKEFVNYSRSLFKHWVFIVQHYYPESMTQRYEDREGKVIYEEFHPREFQHIKLNVDVSTTSMLPFDDYAEWEEAQLLKGQDMMSDEQFIDSAPSLRDKQRAKKYVAEKQEQQQMMAMAQLEAEQGGNGQQLSPEDEAILRGTDKEAIADVLRRNPQLMAESVGAEAQ